MENSAVIKLATTYQKIKLLVDSDLQLFGMMNEYGGRRQKDDNMTDKFFLWTFLNDYKHSSGSKKRSSNVKCL